MSPATWRRAARGMTLVELLIATTVSAFTVAAASTLLIQQQRSFVAGAGDRAQQESGRMALRELTRRLRVAGYGVDSNLVLDFGATPVVPRSDLIEPATNVAFPGYQCAADVRCRDSSDQTRSDELVFLTRDPLFSRVASVVTNTSLTLVGQLKQPMYAGQLLQVSCLSGTRARAYVTVAQDVAAASPADPAALQLVQLLPGSTTGGLPTFGLENATLVDACFSIATAGLQPLVTAVERSRFYVAWYDAAGAVVAPQTAAARPYLMLDRGLRGAAATPVPVAPDVEDLQLSYLFPPAAAGAPQRVVGAALGTSIADELFPVDTAVLPPGYDDVPDAVSRTTGHPANMSAIRISVVVRTSEPDLAFVTDLDRTLPAAGNRAAFLGAPNYRRTLFETTVVLRNLRTASFTFPAVNAAGGTGFNLGGG